MFNGKFIKPKAIRLHICAAVWFYKKTGDCSFITTVFDTARKRTNSEVQALRSEGIIGIESELTQTPKTDHD